MRAPALPATRRRETAETVRHRLPTVLPRTPGPSPDPVLDLLPNPDPAPALTATPTPAPLPPPAARPLGEPPGTTAPPGPVAPPGRRPLRLPTRWLPTGAAGLLDLDRRAVAGLSVLLLLAVGYGVQHFWLGRPQQVSVPVVATPAALPGPTPEAAALPSSARGTASPRPSPGPAAQVVVDVSGKVLHPGLRTLPRGSRVADALRAAGGPVRGADTTGLNLARVLGDGEQITVGRPAVQPATGPGGTATGPVSLNTATVEQLDDLPGVGPVLARHIIEYRDTHGGFTAVGQLRQVTGIGEHKYADISPLVTP